MDARSSSATLFGSAAVVVEQDDPRRFPARLSELHASERGAAASMVDKRRRELVAGRSLARAALRRLGVEPRAVPVGADRAPVWPDGVVGSISHTDDWCIVAVASARDFRALGVDVELDEPLEASLWPMVCRSEERQALNAAEPPLRGRLAKVVFSAKEAAYKAQYPLTRTFLDFCAMRVELDLSRGRWCATMVPEHRPPRCPWDAVEGRFVFEHGHIVTAVAVP